MLNGLHRLEYRGYDSAGLAVDAVCSEQNDLSNNDGSHKTFTRVVRCKGKVASLGQAVKGVFHCLLLYTCTLLSLFVPKHFYMYINYFSTRIFS